MPSTLPDSLSQPKATSITATRSHLHVISHTPFAAPRQHIRVFFFSSASQRLRTGYAHRRRWLQKKYVEPLESGGNSARGRRETVIGKNPPIWSVRCALASSTHTVRKAISGSSRTGYRLRVNPRLGGTFESDAFAFWMCYDPRPSLACALKEPARGIRHVGQEERGR